MEDNKLLAQALLEIAKKSTTEIIEVDSDFDLIEAADKFNISLPSPDLAVIKTVYAEIDKVNKNGIVLPRKAVEKGLPTLIGKQINWEHNGAGRICGYIIDAQINKDQIEITGVIFKSLFPEEMEKVKEKFKKRDLCVSFEIWNRNPEDKESVMHELKNGTRSIDPIIFHGCGLLLVNPPACPKAKVYKLVAKVLTEAEKINDKVFGEDLIFASLAIEEPKCKNCGTCNCTHDKEAVMEELVKKDEKSSEETQTEVKPDETKTEEKSEVAETKSEEPKVEETKEEPKVESEVKPEETPKVEAEAKVEEPKVEEKTEEKKEEVTEEPKVEEKKEEANVITVTQERTTVDEIKPEGEVITTEVKTEQTVVNDEGKETQKVEEEVKTVVTYTWEQVQDEVKKAQEEKDKEITQLKQELATKEQEIADLKNPKVEEKKEKEMTVGSVIVKDNYKAIQTEVNTKAFGKR